VACGGAHLLPEQPPDDVVAVDDDEELVVEDREDVLLVDVRERVGQVEVDARQDHPLLLGLEEVAGDLEDRREHREGAEADRVAHGVREELGDVGQVHAHRRARVEERLRGERHPDERRAHDELVERRERLVVERHEELPAEVALVDRLELLVDPAAYTHAELVVI